MTSFSLGIGLTNECNLRCAHCYRPDAVVERLTRDDVQRVCRSIPVRSANLGVGENGLHPEYEAVRDDLWSAGIKTSITSNGRSIAALSDAAVKRFHSVEFSLDFPTEHGSQAPEELAAVLEPIARGRADFVLGTRHFNGAHPLHAALGSRLVARLLSWRHGVPLTDIAPFRAIRLDLLRRLDMMDRAYGWPVEMVAEAALAGARIVEVPVSHAPRQAGRSKVSGTLLGSLRASYAFLVIAWRASRPAT